MATNQGIISHFKAHFSFLHAYKFCRVSYSFLISKCQYLVQPLCTHSHLDTEEFGNIKKGEILRRLSCLSCIMQDTELSFCYPVSLIIVMCDTFSCGFVLYYKISMVFHSDSLYLSAIIFQLLKKMSQKVNSNFFS